MERKREISGRRKTDKRNNVLFSLHYYFYLPFRETRLFSVDRDLGSLFSPLLRIDISKNFALEFSARVKLRIILKTIDFQSQVHGIERKKKKKEKYNENTHHHFPFSQLLERYVTPDHLRNVVVADVDPRITTRTCVFPPRISTFPSLSARLSPSIYLPITGVVHMPPVLL